MKLGFGSRNIFRPRTNGLSGFFSLSRERTNRLCTIKAVVVLYKILLLCINVFTFFVKEENKTDDQNCLIE